MSFRCQRPASTETNQSSMGPTFLNLQQFNDHFEGKDFQHWHRGRFCSMDYKKCGDGWTMQSLTNNYCDAKDSKARPRDVELGKKQLKDKSLPNLQQWTKHEHCLKRTRHIYLSRIGKVVDHVGAERDTEPLGLPGIGGKQRKGCREKISVHDNKALRSFVESRRKASPADSRSRRGSGSGREESCSSLGGNTSSETGSESWTSGNGSTSPRRRIRPATPAGDSLLLRRGKVSSTISSGKIPHPPSAPRHKYGHKDHLYKSKSHPLEIYGVTTSNNPSDSSDDDDDVDAPMRPRTPGPGMSRRFTSTLQNIQEQCVIEDSSDTDSGDCIATKKVSFSFSRRRSMGEVIDNHKVRNKYDDDDGEYQNNGRNVIHARCQRRMSMPIDLDSLRKRIEGLHFINVREFSRDYIQCILSRRDQRSTVGRAKGDQGQQKCLSWLHSLEEAS